MNQEQVDKWAEENNCDFFCGELLDDKLPKMAAKLDRLDKRIIAILKEVREEFPDACYYTASGGFNLMLGDPHDNTVNCNSQQQRMAWHGSATIGDGDF